MLSDIFKKTKVSVDGHHYFYTKRGLIQGSWLSPLLFNVYINDLLLELEKNYFIKAYADDLVVGLTNPHDLDECLDIINRWSQKTILKSMLTKATY